MIGQGMFGCQRTDQASERLLATIGLRHPEWAATGVADEANHETRSQTFYTRKQHPSLGLAACTGLPPDGGMVQDKKAKSERCLDSARLVAHTAPCIESKKG